MLRGVCLWVFMIFMVFQATGQEQYRVVFAGGRSYQVTENRFSMLQSGQMLDAEVALELVGQSRVVLMDEAGRLISLSLGGRYPLKDLQMSAVSDSSLFIKSVWDQYYEAYDRGISIQEELLARDTPLSFELTIPSSSQFFGQTLFVKSTDISSQGYELRYVNEYGEVIKSATQMTSEMLIALSEPPLVWKSEISIQVKRLDTKALSPVYTLRKLSPPDYEDIDRLLKKEFKGNQFEMELTKAAFFENQSLFADAQTVILSTRLELGAMMDNFWKYYLYKNGFYAMSRR